MKLQTIEIHPFGFILKVPPKQSAKKALEMMDDSGNPYRWIPTPYGLRLEEYRLTQDGLGWNSVATLFNLETEEEEEEDGKEEEGSNL
jgi:hypothetical protein